jgi:hypothetical protein
MRIGIRSHDYYGVQIADVLASCIRYVFEHRNDAEAQQWLKQLLPQISKESVLFDPDVLDLNTPEAFANTVLLQELALLR